MTTKWNLQRERERERGKGFAELLQVEEVQEAWTR
jgi:hypothetical protein